MLVPAIRTSQAGITTPPPEAALSLHMAVAMATETDSATRTRAWQPVVPARLNARSSAVTRMMSVVMVTKWGQTAAPLVAARVLAT